MSGSNESTGLRPPPPPPPVRPRQQHQTSRPGSVQPAVRTPPQQRPQTRRPVPVPQGIRPPQRPQTSRPGPVPPVIRPPQRPRPSPVPPVIPPPQQVQTSRPSSSGVAQPPRSDKGDCRHTGAHKLELKNFAKSFKCDGCHQESVGYRHRCVDCNYEFHDECRNSSSLKDINKDDHRHHYTLRSYNKIFQCDGCQEEGFGKRFRCDQCGHELHTVCRFPKLPPIRHFLLGQFTFRFHRSNKNEGKWCDACGEDIDGYSYQCKEKNWDLHPCCFNLGTRFTAGEGEDIKTFELKTRVPADSRKCFWCKHNKLQNGDSERL